ncbi:DUF4129 domain-containing protein [Salinadaptatus halalkaliphilus]|uniref:DUF4129 domain-containing protein n=2 Tax=Salinadaptatus halalkaliphilus TaxID=2419781 RepID=A0A4S3TP97_9EURY|nr:DUF4129 domain-containing protein [Salinadaptatus halalkaliphilus]
MLCLGITGILVVAVAAPALPTAISVVDDDQTLDPADLDDEEAQLLEEAVGEQPEGDESGSLPAEWLLLGVAIVGLVILVRIARSNPETSALVLALGIGGVAAVLGWLVLAGWGGETSLTATIADSVALVVAALALVLAVAGTAVILARDATETPPLEATATTVERHQQPPADNASPAATLETPSDRPADNDIYQAWQTVTESVGKGDDDTATADDVRAAAIDHGFDAETVGELQRLFEDSRYGDRNPTAKREQRARELGRGLHATEDDSDA